MDRYIELLLADNKRRTKQRSEGGDVSSEEPSYASSRIQKAYRSNIVESLRLENRLYSLDRERRHGQRLHNQHIRLLGCALQQIQTSSGNSPEGRPPDWHPVEYKAGLGNLYLYGEKIIHRHEYRIRRVRSSLEPGALRRSGSELSVSSVRSTSSYRSSASWPTDVLQLGHASLPRISTAGSTPQ